MPETARPRPCPGPICSPRAAAAQCRRLRDHHRGDSVQYGVSSRHTR